MLLFSLIFRCYYHHFGDLLFICFKIKEKSNKKKKNQDYISKVTPEKPFFHF